MQTGGLLKDLTVERDGAADRAPVPRVPGRSTRCSTGPASPTSPTGWSGKCSGGQQQRLRFALALLPDPELLILDEPTTGMDVEGRRDFWAAIREDAARGRTVLFATHYLEEADAYADRIVLVRHGRIVADGTAAEVKALAAGRTRPGHAARRRPGARSRRCRASTAVEVRGDRVLVARARLATPSPATCSPAPTRATSRSPRATSRTRSSP